MKTSITFLLLSFLVASCSQFKKTNAPSPPETIKKNQTTLSRKVAPPSDLPELPLDRSQTEQTKKNGFVTYVRPTSPYPDLENEDSTLSKEDLEREAEILQDQNNVKIISPPETP